MGPEPWQSRCTRFTAKLWLAPKVSGFLTTVGYQSYTHASFDAFFGVGVGSNFSTGVLEGNGAIDEDSVLSQTLLHAGQLANPMTRTVNIRANLNMNVVSSRNESSVASADFSNSVHFIEMMVPPNVTWTSDSGVFLADVPEPGSLVLLATGAVALLAHPWRRREQAAWH